MLQINCDILYDDEHCHDIFKIVATSYDLFDIIKRDNRLVFEDMYTKTPPHTTVIHADDVVTLIEMPNSTYVFTNDCFFEIKDLDDVDKIKKLSRSVAYCR